MEEHINVTLLDVQKRAAYRAEQSQILVQNLIQEHQPILKMQQVATSDRHQMWVCLKQPENQTNNNEENAEEKARAVAVSELDERLGQAHVDLEERVLRRAEKRAMNLEECQLLVGSGFNLKAPW
ncbi:uncharacterized protein PITG_07112 [Phytophthora infestans T30-4]|uniref:Uncharacterized protein n=1 Tax=Phytophthora infestans (strain T30-4) TaxID=403677 RepID=D0N7A8_PHYIT|nr:uncharacterized protein PITG_07112 [Phytophthora infestans T30-4]EEY53457.1 hypothetical protein PITG_07112 [Phytophthora infestans T30-4]|eukprot:XP_002905075.1 hypothetical protein PITG_07112 [Phytophthora infestans T30-4]